MTTIKNVKSLFTPIDNKITYKKVELRSKRTRKNKLIDARAYKEVH